MSTVIQIKRSSGSAAPTTSDLVEGELAYAEDASNDGASAKLYIESVDSGSAAVIHAIGGKYFTDQIDAATNNNTASTIVKRDGSGNFTAGTITADLTGTASDATALETARNIAGVSFDGTADINIPVGNLSDVTISSATSGQVLKYNGSAWVNAADSDDLSDNDTDDLAEGATNLYHTTERVQDVVGGQLVTNGSHSGISASYDDANDGAVDLSLTNTGVTAASYGSTTAVPVITVDAQGRITAASTASISTSFDIAADSGSNDTVAGGETLTFAGTANEIETTVTNNQIAIGLVTNPTVGGNLTVSGNLTVNGTTTTVNTTNLDVTDPLFKLASGNNTTDSVDIGFFGLYDTSGSQDLYSGLFRDASDSGKWKLFKDAQSAPTTTVDTAGAGYAVGTLVANLESSSATITGGTITGITDLVVADGGTGVSSFTSNGILYGNGSGAIQATAAGTDGYFLKSNNGTPEWSNSFDGGTY